MKAIEKIESRSVMNMEDLYFSGLSSSFQGFGTVFCFSVKNSRSSVVLSYAWSILNLMCESTG